MLYHKQFHNRRFLHFDLKVLMLKYFEIEAIHHLSIYHISIRLKEIFSNLIFNISYLSNGFIKTDMFYVIIHSANKLFAVSKNFFSSPLYNEWHSWKLYHYLLIRKKHIKSCIRKKVILVYCLIFGVIYDALLALSILKNDLIPYLATLC